MTGTPGPSVPEAVLSELRWALDRTGSVAQLLLRGRPAAARRPAAHAIGVVFARIPPDGEAIRAAAEPLLVEALGPQVAARWPSAGRSR